jgi:hypothetical protein
MWIYNDKEFTSDMIEDYHGFVYEITDLHNNKKYIGKKNFWKKVTKPPLKGKKNKRRSIKESDWQNYYGSNKEVKTLVEEFGGVRFKRTILKLCVSSGQLNYFEMKEQIDKDVLFKPDEYYNAFIGGRIHRKHVIKKK